MWDDWKRLEAEQIDAARKQRELAEYKRRMRTQQRTEAEASSTEPVVKWSALSDAPERPQRLAVVPDTAAKDTGAPEPLDDATRHALREQRGRMVQEAAERMAGGDRSLWEALPLSVRRWARAQAREALRALGLLDG